MQVFHDYDKELKREHLGEGEWVEEPDTVLFEHQGIKCLIRRVFVRDGSESYFGGHLCGYCSLPKGHPWENMSYDEIPIEVHGGVTFMERDMETDQMLVGFDCAHTDDIMPSMKDIIGKELEMYFHSTYKNIVYVSGECVSMAEQIIQGAKTCDT